MALMAHWILIAGKELAAMTWPGKIVLTHTKDATLYVFVHPSHILHAWSQSAVLIQRVNQFFGHEAIARIRFFKKVDRTMSGMQHKGQ